MLLPIIISTVFVLAFVILCMTKPDAGRIFLGLFFLIMAIGVNGYFTVANPHSYVEYASEALIPFYRDVALSVVELNPVLFGWLLILFEVAMGSLLLHKHKSVKIGLIGTIIFLIGIAPLGFTQIPWLGLIIGEAYLLTKDFPDTFLQVIQTRLRPSVWSGKRRSFF